MNRVKSSHHRWEGLACALQNSFRKRIDRQRFVHDPNFSYKIGHVLIGKVTGKPESVNIPQSLDAPQIAAQSPLPLAPTRRPDSVPGREYEQSPRYRCRPSSTSTIFEKCLHRRYRAPRLNSLYFSQIFHRPRGSRHLGIRARRRKDSSDAVAMRTSPRFPALSSLSQDSSSASPLTWLHLLQS